jgi:hypothetical protein
MKRKGLLFGCVAASPRVDADEDTLKIGDSLGT